MDFPLFKTKITNCSRKFDLTNFEERKEYFELKAGEEIKKLKSFLRKNTFVAYFLGKKNSGKGTYAKMLQEIIGEEMIEHFSVGDMVREVSGFLKNEGKRKDFISFLEKNYRGPLSLQEALRTLEERNTKVLLPSELILVMIKRVLSEKGKKTILIDGFPRDLDQISYSLFFREVIGYRDDPDIFVLIDVPEAVINERIKYRVICPLCHTSRNLKLLPTTKIGVEEKNGERNFYLICDNPRCRGERMVTKEGDELGIEPIKERLNKDGELLRRALSLHGIPKILLRNSVPVNQAAEFVDDYEITPAYSYEFDEKSGQVRVIKKPWVIKGEKGEEVYTLMPPPVVVSLIKQLVKVLAI